MEIEDLNTLQIAEWIRTEIEQITNDPNISQEDKMEMIEDFEKIVEFVKNNPADISSRILMGVASNREQVKFLKEINNKDH